MTPYIVRVPVTIEARILVEVPNDIVAEGSEIARDWAIEHAQLPELCASCSGWGGRDGYATTGNDDADWDHVEAEVSA